MEYNTIFVRYGELALKGKNRRNFISLLEKNIRKTLKPFPKLEIQAGFDRLFIALNGESYKEVDARLKEVFGLSSFSPAIKCAPDLEAIKKELEGLDFEAPATFKMETHRHDKSFPMSSDQINRDLAGWILKRSNWKVDVHHPEKRIRIEIRKDAAYIMFEKIAGAGGYPVGIEGKAIVLLSGGIDSPVASYMVMKRGVKLEAIHFASPPYTSMQARDKVLSLADQLSRFQGELKVHLIPFTSLQLAIYEHAPESYAITIMRRMMVRIAMALAKKEGALALASGESLGQVASQTLDSIFVINEVTNMPILRPLIGLDKVEIIDLARKIGTYETSILPFEDCCTIFTPKNPITHPKLEKCLKIEEKWDWKEMIEDCLKMEEVITLPAKKEDEEDFF